jgi:O-methyltransferase
MSLAALAKQKIFSFLDTYGYRIVRIPKANDARLINNLPDRDLYQPFFSPWLSDQVDKEFAQNYAHAKGNTMVRQESCWVLSSLAKQALALGGDFCELGVYRGGSAYLLLQLLKRHNRETAGAPKFLHLFDTFSGMPDVTNEKDWHKAGDFAKTDLSLVQNFLNDNEICKFYPGLIPDTFATAKFDKLAMVHIDLDLHDSIYAATTALFPLLQVGGIMLFDDYGFPTCPGARQAIDNYFRGTAYFPIVLSTGQAIVFKAA